jgi:hypothetical protein
VSTDTATEVATEAPEQQQDALTSSEQLFRYSGWVHVGPGAHECEAVDEDKGESNCADPRHFHAWCRLPNQFQHREIREKALAAKARKTRQLRDPETDGYTILEENLDAIARKGDEAVDLLVEELVGREWWTDYAEAAKDVQELEEGVDENEQPIRPYEHVERDEARLEELRELPEEQRPKDEIEELERHLARYAEALKKRQEEIVAPKREALKKNGLNGLLDLVRDQRVLAAGTEEFMHVFSTWSWLLGTYRQPGGELVWPPDPSALRSVAPEVIEAVKEMFEDLERTERRGLEGN